MEILWSCTGRTCRDILRLDGIAPVKITYDVLTRLQHAVFPDDKLRFALTARYVIPEKVPPKERREGVFSLPPDMEYNGE
jgi:hypothetical protein